MRNAEELSTTVAPAAANLGACSLDRPPPAADRAMPDDRVGEIGDRAAARPFDRATPLLVGGEQEDLLAARAGGQHHALGHAETHFSRREVGHQDDMPAGPFFRCEGGLDARDDGARLITRQQAAWWHGLQTLTGDSTDNYKGCPGIGPVKAQQILPLPDRGLNDDAYQAAVWAAVLQQYAEKGRDHQEAATQAAVAYLLRFENWDPKAGEVVLWQKPKP